ncbi:WG repeat-containing protein [uncultured Aquimarina sp.]|uniref:WG repeat-containing protein n=1 Tax=uncultured Aquimarina sp. TaxID=575652 RepID=UPI00260C3198|nr:WG repeat-containing protein [uncultured Aquimarina sp.]
MKTNKLLLLLAILISGISYSQLDGKTINKRVSKLKKKYKYVSQVSKCNTVLVGEYIYGGNDGGGRIPKGIQNMKLISLENKKLQEDTKLKYAKALTLNYKQVKEYKRLYTIEGINGKIGVLDLCGNVIVEPKYDFINPFNKEGQAVAFVNNKIDVVDLSGKSILNDPFKYSLKKEDFFTPRRTSKYLQVVNNNIIVGNDEGNYALFNITENKEITPFKYSFIYPNIFDHTRKNEIGFKAVSEGKQTLLDLTNGEELLPLTFYEIDDFISIANKKFVRGTIDKEEKTNVLDIIENKFIFSDEIHLNRFNKIKPITQKLWNVEISYPLEKKNQYNPANGKLGLYDTEKSDFVIKPDKNISYIDLVRDIFGDTLTNALKISYKSNEGKLYLISPWKVILEFQSSAPEFKKIKLKNDTKTNEFYLMSVQPNRKSSKKLFTLFDTKWNKIFENIRAYAPKVKEDVFYFFERINCSPSPCENVYTAYDIDGKLIGEKQKYKIE